MDIDEAIKILKKECCYECGYGTSSMIECKNTACELITAAKMSIQALEKQAHEETSALEE